MMLYNSTLPSYNDDKEDDGGNKSKKDENVINADDPKNRHLVAKILSE